MCSSLVESFSGLFLKGHVGCIILSGTFWYSGYYGGLVLQFYDMSWGGRGVHVFPCHGFAYRKTTPDSGSGLRSPPQLLWFYPFFHPFSSHITLCASSSHATHHVPLPHWTPSYLLHTHMPNPQLSNPSLVPIHCASSSCHIPLTHLSYSFPIVSPF